MNRTKTHMPKKPIPITEQDLRAKLEAAVTLHDRAGMSGVARDLDIDVSCLHRFLKSGRPPQPQLLRAMGLCPLVMYVPAKRA